MLIRCAGATCPFTGARALPILTVDEAIYRRLPAFVIATVDKFAGAALARGGGRLLRQRRPRRRMGFLRRGRRRAQGRRCSAGASLLPPALIVQDELHLISGPLGTVAALYETVLDRLATRTREGKRVRPKVVASTATVRRAAAQIEALFDRKQTEVFPPPGPDRRDSFFAKTVPSAEKPARLYVGLASPGKGPKLIFLRALLSLLAAAQKEADAGAAADPYLSALCYTPIEGAKRGLRREVYWIWLGDDWGGFLSPRQRAELMALLRDGHTEQRLARRANALLLLDDSWSCEKVAKALYLDDDTVRGWRKTYVADGLEGLGASKAAAARAICRRSRNRVEGLDRRDFAALDEGGRGLYRAGVRRRLREPLGADRHAASAWARIREAGSDRTQAPPGKAEGVHPSLREPSQLARPRRGRAVLGRHPSNARGASGRLLGTGQGPSRDRANQRAAAPQRSRRHRSRDRQDCDDRRRNRRRGLNDEPARNDRADVSAARRDPRLSRQCALSPRSSRSAVAGSTRKADQAAFHSRLLPAFEPDRALVGRHAQASDAQHMLRQPSRVRRDGSHFPTRARPQTLARTSRFVTDNFRVIDPKDFRVPT